MKTLFKIHPFTVISLFITFITGYFKESVVIMAIIIFHELGHILMALYFKWRISEIVVLPFGCITIFNELINKPLKEEFLITIMGPLFQIGLTIFLNNSVITFYSLFILILNLIPIYPLDGAKILNVFFNKIFSFKLSHSIIIYLSLLTSILVIILKNNLLIILFILVLVIKLVDEYNKHEIIFNKFLYERYLYKLKFKNVKIVSNFNKFNRDYYHYLRFNNDFTSEKEALKKKYQ